MSAGEPVRHRINRGNNILFIVYLLKSVFVIGYPAASFQYGNRFLRLNLISGITAGLRSAFLFRCRDVQFSEYLLERLADGFVKQELLISMPVAARIQVCRMGDT